MTYDRDSTWFSSDVSKINKKLWYKPKPILCMLHAWYGGQYGQWNSVLRKILVYLYADCSKASWAFSHVRVVVRNATTSAYDD